MGTNYFSIKKAFLLLLLLATSFSFEAQYRGYSRKKTKNSAAEGTLFFYWGYNRSIYTKSTIQFVGQGYDFRLKGVEATDRPTKELSKYFSIRNLTEPQFNLRVGYNFKNYWAVSIGYDHLKYVMKHNVPYILSGRINPGVDNVTGWSGNYGGDTVFTQEQTFHYENTNGMNYIRAEISRVRPWVKGKGGKFTFSTLTGGSLGVLFNVNDFTFAGRKDMQTQSVSGFGVSGHLGARFEFFKHFFIQANVAGGFMMQSRVMIRANDYDSYARHRFGYGAGEIVMGGLFYIRPKNDCNSCPSWGKG
jgi:hypothetical protein